MKLGGVHAVHLHDADAGATVSFAPGDDVPDWAVKLITNPYVWEDVPEPRPATKPVQVRELGGRPPTAGPGVSRQVWADWAETHNVPIQEDWKRDQIIEACDKAGV